MGWGCPLLKDYYWRKRHRLKGVECKVILSGHTDTRCYILPIVNPIFYAEDRKVEPCQDPKNLVRASLKRVYNVLLWRIHSTYISLSVNGSAYTVTSTAVYIKRARLLTIWTRYCLSLTNWQNSLRPSMSAAALRQHLACRSSRSSYKACHGYAKIPTEQHPSDN